MSPVDPLGAIRAALLADGLVAAAMADRVYVGELPGEQAADMPRGGAVLRHAGGAGAPPHAPVVQVRFDLHAFGATTHTASAVHWLLHAALRRIERQAWGGTLVHSVLPETGPFAQRDPTTDWPELVSSWAVLAAEEAP